MKHSGNNVKIIETNPVLTVKQKDFLITFAHSSLSDAFYFTGGTALSAFYLHHRMSEDMDFFSVEDVPYETIRRFLDSIQNVSNIQYQKHYDRRIFFLEFFDKEILKVEFTAYPFPIIGNEFIRIYKGLKVNNLKDMLVNKINAMVERNEIKDFIDVYFILKQRHFDECEVIGELEKKTQTAGYYYILQRRFLELEGIQMPLPIMLKGIDREDLIRFYNGACTRLIEYIAKRGLGGSGLDV